MPDREPAAAPTVAPAAAPAGSAGSGAALALVAFLSWGLLVPVYFRALAGVPPVELLAHRVAWSLVLLAAAAAALGRFRPALQALLDRRTLALLLASAALIAANWLIFIWAVQRERLLDVSLGYFINPLVNVALGVLLLRERLRPAQRAATALAALGVASLVVSRGELPLTALALAGTFGAYGLLRKLARVDAIGGLMLETALLTPLALAWLARLALRDELAFASAPARTQVLVAAAGIVTALPLLAFIGAARRLTLTTIGFFQYLAPTGQFLLAVFAWGEPLDAGRLAAFVAIWAALAIVSADAVAVSRARKTAAPA